MPIDELELQVTGKGSAYLRLPGHPRAPGGCRSRTLADLIGAYKGPYIVFDFDHDDVLVGIEILTDDDDEDAEEDGADE